MKKALAIGLAAVMAVSMSAPVFASDDSESGAGIAKEDLKIGAIYIGDENEGYTAAHMAGIDEMVENLGLDDSQVIEKTLIGEDEGCYDAAADLADQGCQIIFANSFGHETYILEAAGEYPDVQFCHATGTQASSSGLSNMHNYFTNIYEARYVSGVVAGLKLNEMIEDGTVKEDACKIGYVGAFPYAEVISGYTSFYLGAKSVCPSATMEVKYTNSWASFDLEKECADILDDYQERVFDLLWREVKEGKEEELLLYGSGAMESLQLDVKNKFDVVLQKIREKQIEMFIEYLRANTSDKKAYEYSTKLREYSNRVEYEQIIGKQIGKLLLKSSFPINSVTKDKYNTCCNIIIVLHKYMEEEVNAYQEEILKESDKMVRYRVERMPTRTL